MTSITQTIPDVIWQNPSSLPILNWRNYTSFKGYNPDWLEIKVLSTDTFSTQEGICCNVLVDGEETILPLKARRHNAKLLKSWKDNVITGRIKEGTEFMLKTWLFRNENFKIERRFAFQIGGK